MVTSILNNLFSSTPNETLASKKPAPIRALPSSWYTSPSLYQIERRAIFSRKWILFTHQLRLESPGSWLKYSVAGYELVLCRDRTGTINCFHNICRHRGFPVVNKDAPAGQARIFSCQYHGWSYGLDGRLAKAPGYQELDGFEKELNGLLRVHVHIDTLGFIWVNLDSSPTPIPWDNDFGGVDRQKRFEAFDFSHYHFDHTWEIEGEFNWKLLGDNYNECYHCPTAHPDVADVVNLDVYSVDTVGGHIQHVPTQDADVDVPDKLKIASTFYFPNASMTVAAPFFFIQRVEPISTTKTMLRYEVYRHNNATDAEFDDINARFKRIMNEDKYLCIAVQKNMDQGVFVNGELHPRMEKGPLYFQKAIRELVLEHHRKEEENGGEIWPARQTVDPASLADDQFCSGLSCKSGESAVEW